MRFLELNLSAKVHCCFVLLLLLLLLLLFFFLLSFDVFMLWGRDLLDKKP